MRYIFECTENNSMKYMKILTNNTEALGVS